MLVQSILDCKVDRIIEEDGICHIFAKILDRLAESDLLDDKGHFLKMTALHRLTLWVMVISVSIAI